MRYVVLLTQPDHFTRWAETSAEDKRAAFATFGEFASALAGRGGEIVAGEGLAEPGTARTLGPGSPAERTVTDGPFAESVEQIGGFFLVDAPDIEDVVACARVLPYDWTVEVRPVTGTDVSG